MASVSDNQIPDPLPPESDLEKGSAVSGAGTAGSGRNSGGEAAVAAVMRRWRTEDLLDKSVLLLRSATLFFSVISFLVMASNKHGDWMQFDKYEEYRYIVAIGVLTFLYSLFQVVRHLHRLNGGRDPIPSNKSFLIDFSCDQVTAYLLMSAVSAAIPITNRMRVGVDNMFTDSSAAAISMGFFAFVAVSLSALISGFKLCKQAYI